MKIIETNKWLSKYYDQPLKLCGQLEPYFPPHTSAQDIYVYLTAYGMYMYPSMNGNELIKQLLLNDVWSFVKREGNELQKIWGGPEIEIFILPSDPMNVEMQQLTNGRSGLAFKDKLFLFIPQKNNTQELKALLTHEYNHVCRLNKITKFEDDFTLLDTIILEGIAENAVREIVGIQHIAPWLTQYSHDVLDKFWEQIILPNKHILKHTPKHNAILYGFHKYPKMAGYCVGYHLVQKYLKKHMLSSVDLLHLPSEVIVSC